MNQRQLIAFVIMGIMLVIWMQFFLPKPPPPAPETPVTEAVTQEATKVTVPVQPVTPAPTPAVVVPATDYPLPAAWTTEAPQSDEVALSDEHMELVFTRVGARLKKARILLGEDDTDSIQMVPHWSDETQDKDAVYPLGLRFSKKELGDALDTLRWESIPNETGNGLTFRLDLGWAQVEKVFTLGKVPCMLDVAVTYTNLRSGSQVLGTDTGDLAYSLNWGPNVNSGDEDNRMVPQQVVWRQNGETLRFPTAKWDSNENNLNFERIPSADFGAIRSAYFVVALKADFGESEGWSQGTTKHFRIGAGVPRMELASGETQTNTYKVYMGPRTQSMLKDPWDNLDSLMELFDVWGFTPLATFMNWFARFLLGMMNWFYNTIFANYGWAIIFVTVLVRGGMYPLTLKSTRSMKKMQKLQPEIAKLKEELGEDQQEMQKQMMALYKERGVNPLGGCFPVLLQLPVFIAFYRLLASTFELRRAPFMFWITDLTEPDALFKLPFTLPIPMMPIDTFNVLPILVALSMVVSQKLMPTSGPAQNQQQKIIMTLMPIMMGVIFYNMDSGLNLYIFASTLVGIAQNYLVHVSDTDMTPKKKTTAPKKRPKHFYAAAQSRKREIAKETRRMKKSKHQSPKKKDDK
jgi:YidC/Oxa1 family membrane protein insertase